MRKAEVYEFDRLAGRIWEREPHGFAFAYDDSYQKSPDALPISHLMPIQDAPYIGETLFPFFDGLIPEGGFSTSRRRRGSLIHATGSGSFWLVAGVASAP